MNRISELYKRGGIREVFNGIGRYIYFDTPIRRLHRWVTLRNGGSIRVFSVDDINARFHITNKTEFRRFRSIDPYSNETGILSEVMTNISGDEIFYDIGANVGLYSCTVGKILDDGKVYAFEPHPTNAARIRENADLNDVTISVQDYALSDVDGTQTLSGVSDSLPGENHSLSSSSDTTGFEVAVRRLDDLVDSQITPPDIIKIDVEGAEFDVLKGMERTLETYQPVIYCEIHREAISNFGATVNEITDFLEDKGYSYEVINERNSELFIRAA